MPKFASPAVSPAMTTAPSMIPMPNMKAGIMSNMMTTPVTYIPPLCDGACGTTPRSQMPMWSMMRMEMMQMMRMIPSMCWTMLTHRQHMTWADMGDMMMRTVLACMEMGMMVMVIPLWLMMPGAMFAMWMATCAMVVMGMCWMLNGKEQTHMCNMESEGWMMGPEMENEKWMFMGGMGMSNRHCHMQTLPAMSRMFNRPMMCVCMPTWGLPFDMMCMMMQRCMMMPSQVRRNLYDQMRSALLDDSMHRCVVMAHNDAAVIVSQAVSQLCCDLPTEKLRKLEIYTFGAAASEFLMPVGESMMDSEPSLHSTPDMMTERKGVHVEHFAMATDPFAQMGVLQSVRQNMNGRFCGGVVIMNNNMPMKSNMNMMEMCCGMMMEDYLMALFPAQMSTGAGATYRSVLDSPMMIDRDCAEKREIAAMGNCHASSALMKKRGGKRLSWTGLAATAGQKNGINAGMVGLERARKGCKGCDGHMGREVSWLVRYVNMGHAMHMDKNMTNGTHTP
ncbi:hypothetical protein QBC35DRAFT_463850 [Podospora australis]|uniref:Uncharacterized protein n=1 Tax=Podospora australis TaxID=1536484 RepID=A0AAN6WVV4_9PEZI|nr:hypothetical protein QBC35DRAFT_463850 [Podospora australis]